MSKKDKVIPLRGPETAFVSEVMMVIERHAETLTIHQMIGGLFEISVDLLEGDKEE